MRKKSILCRSSNFIGFFFPRRQVELGTATLKTRNAEKKTPRDSFLRKKKNASGGVESKFLSCKECGIEFCTGDGCKIFDYDSFKRVTVSATQPVGEPAPVSQDKKPSRKKLANRGPRTKSRPSNDDNTAANKNVAALNKTRDDQNNVISVKTDKKNATVIAPPPPDKSKKYFKPMISDRVPSSRGTVGVKKPTK